MNWQDILEQSKKEVKLFPIRNIQQSGVAHKIDWTKVKAKGIEIIENEIIPAIEKDLK